MSLAHWYEPGGDGLYGTRKRWDSIRSDDSHGSDEGAQHDVQVRNPNIADMEEDFLYHFALGTKTHDLKAMFEDVKFVVVGGSPKRMELFAKYISQEIGTIMPAGTSLTNIAGATDRYVLFKTGPVLIASHGIGIPSLSIMMHEIIKMLHYAGSTDVYFFRLGTSGGVGLEPGTVVISESAVDGLLRPELEMAILGKLVKRPAHLDPVLVKELLLTGKPDDNYRLVSGKTMCTLDFYEGQGRLDGAFCDYTEEDKMNFLREVHSKGVRNIEMESLCFAAMCHRAGIKGAVVCVTLLDRLQGDQITTPHEQLKEWDTRPSQTISRFIKKQLGQEST